MLSYIEFVKNQLSRHGNVLVDR